MANNKHVIAVLELRNVDTTGIPFSAYLTSLQEQMEATDFTHLGDHFTVAVVGFNPEMDPRDC